MNSPLMCHGTMRRGLGTGALWGAAGAALAVLAMSGSPAIASTPARGYERVTPADAPDEVYALGPGFAVGVTADGNHVFYDSPQAMVPTAPDAPMVFRADRTASGWRTVAPMPAPIPGSEGGFVALDAFSDQSLSAVVSTQRSFDPSDGDDPVFNAGDIYTVGSDGAMTLDSVNEVTCCEGSGELNQLQAVSADGSSVVFLHDPNPLLPIDPGSPFFALYQHDSRGLHFVSVDNGGAVLSHFETVIGGVGTDGTPLAFNAFSRNGSRLFFTALPGSGDPSDQPGLYVRIDGSDTEPIPAAPANASSVFLGATPDGHEVFFATDQQLVPADTNASEDLYAYDLDRHDLTWLSQGGAPADVLSRPVWSSDDGSRVYFTASGDLVPGAGTPGAVRTWVSDHGHLRFVADTELMVRPDTYLTNGLWGAPECGPTRVSPDGRYLLAQTGVSLLAQDRDGGVQDVYRYDLDSGSWSLVSTSPIDQQGADNALIGPQAGDGRLTSCYPGLAHLTHPMSDDGRFVFFQTRAKLVPEDTNDRYDVYQWDAQAGSVSLISSGTSDDHSDFLDATPSGDAVLFDTRAQMVPSDTDQRFDLYEARTGPVIPDSGPVRGTACSDSDCQGPGVSPPVLSAPGSAAVTGGLSASGEVVARLRIRRPSAAQLRRLLATGVLRVTVVPSVTGRLELSLTLRRRGRRGVVTATATGSGEAGRPKRLTVRLPRAARAVLHRPADLRLTLSTVDAGGDRVAVRVRLPRSRGRA